MGGGTVEVISMLGEVVKMSRLRCRWNESAARVEHGACAKASRVTNRVISSEAFDSVNTTAAEKGAF